MKSLLFKPRWYRSLLLAACFGFTGIFTVFANTSSSGEETKYSFLSYAELNNKYLEQPHVVIEKFYAAVHRGELIVFEMKVDGNMISPIRIEYVYELNGNDPTVKIYSEFKKFISISLDEGINIKLGGISTILDSSGYIIEIRAHVVPE